MCDVCRSCKMDIQQINGKYTALTIVTIWSFFEDIAQIKVCYFHGVEIFMIGETRFFHAYPELAADIRVNKNKYTDISLAREA